MIPIGILTRNRHEILDVTLRSLSATELPDEQEIVVFDDRSENVDTLRYLYTSEAVSLKYNWPDLPILRNIVSVDSGPGLFGKVTVVQLSSNPLGVMRASCLMLRMLIERYGTKHGIIYCQDDVIFNENWFARLTQAVPSDAGLTAGLWLNKDLPVSNTPIRVSSGGITAQCYYITPLGLAAIKTFIETPPALPAGFDNKLCAAVRSRATVYMVSPAIGQHIGIDSGVRPQIGWQAWDPRGRLDYSACGPFVLASEVKKFVCA